MVQSLRVIQTQQEERERGNVKMSTLQQRRLEQLEEALLAAQGQCQVAYWPGNLIAVLLPSFCAYMFALNLFHGLGYPLFSGCAAYARRTVIPTTTLSKHQSTPGPCLLAVLGLTVRRLVSMLLYRLGSQLLTSERDYLQACLDKAAARQQAAAESEQKMALLQAAHDDEVRDGGP